MPTAEYLPVYEHPMNVEANSIIESCPANKLPPHVEESTKLRNQIHDVITAYPELSVYEILGALDIVKADLIEMLGQLGRPA
jgi:hypothetical protein